MAGRQAAGGVTGRICMKVTKLTKCCDDSGVSGSLSDQAPESEPCVGCYGTEGRFGGNSDVSCVVWGLEQLDQSLLLASSSTVGGRGADAAAQLTFCVHPANLGVFASLRESVF